MLMRADTSVLVVIDVQERLAPAMDGLAGFLRNTGILMRAAARLEVPMIVTAQYPKGLGRTVEELAGLAPPEAVVEKITFSATGCDSSKKRSRSQGAAAVTSSTGPGGSATAPASPSRLAAVA